MSESDKQSRSIAGMEGIQSAIANDEVERVKQLLATHSLDILQKQHLIELAKMGNNPKMLSLIEDAPAHP
ncbi:hypothetical protein [Salinimonas lutimaris]|uniref:hypothetical protein n=1 Tax=Salinimonas lutimaris TaxID=914153 RepID=UPI0010C0E036|nr:hypothetical protein [Salinimonas lutimaris]